MATASKNLAEIAARSASNPFAQSEYAKIVNQVNEKSTKGPQTIAAEAEAYKSGKIVTGDQVGSTSGGQGLAPTPIYNQAITYTNNPSTAPKRYDTNGNLITKPASTSPGMPNEPTPPTVAPGMTDASSGSGSLPRLLSQDEWKAKYGPKDVDESAIRERIRTEQQAKIDAVNAVYDDMVRNQRVTNEGNQGAVRAINARSGLIGSDFGAANDSNQRAAGDQAIGAINREREARVTSILAEVDRLSDGKIEAERARLQGENDRYQEYLEKAQTQSKELIKNLGANGMGFDELREKNPNGLKSLLESTGLSEFELALQMNASKKTAERIEWKMERKGNLLIASGVNPVTGKIEYHTETVPSELGDSANLDAITTNDGVYVYDKDNPKRDANGNVILTRVGDAKSNLPTSVQEYEYAKENGFDGAYNDWLTQDANRKARYMNPSGLDTATASRVDRLTGQFDNEPIVKNYTVLQEAKESVKTFSENPSSTNDQALIYAFAKAMDPNSVVREGEYATVQKYAQSWATKLGFEAQRLFSEDPQFLSPEARKSIIDTINAKYGVIEKQYNNLTEDYGRRINRITGQDDGKSYIANYGSAFMEDQGEDQPTQQITIQDIENSAGMTLSPDKKKKAQDAIDYYKSQGIDPSLEDINELLGFKNVPNMTLNGSLGDVSNTKNVPPAQVNVSTALGNGIISGYGSKFWQPGLDFVLPGGKNAQVKFPVNTQVIAVIPAEKSKGFGNQVKLRMPDGKELWVSHLDKMLVKPGQTLRAGIALGTQGNTGKTYSAVGRTDSESGIHLDLTMPKPGGGYYTAQQVAAYLKAQKLS